MKYKYLLLIFVLIGTGFVAGGVYSYTRVETLLEVGVTVDGEVTKLDRILKDGGWTYKPVVEFVDHTGVSRTLISGVATNPPRYFEGEKLKVIYDPNDPKYPVNARIYDTFGLWGAAMMLSGLGGFFILVAAGCWFLFSRGGGISANDSRPSDGYEF